MFLNRHYQLSQLKARQLFNDDVSQAPITILLLTLHLRIMLGDRI